MSLREVKGTVEAVNDKKSEDYYGVLLESADGEWLNGEGELEKNVGAGDRVRAVYDDEAEFYDLEELEVVDSDGSDASGEKGFSPRPVAESSDGDPIWLNESGDGRVYLNDSENDRAIFLNNDLLIDAALRVLEVRSQYGQAEGSKSEGESQ